jgi:hypothetical protein
MKEVTRKLIYLAIVPALLVFASSCISFGKYDIVYETGLFPDTVVNLRTANTRFDDYNSAGPPTIGYNFPLMFSTNRGTEGLEYDLISYELYISFDQHYGSLEIYASEMAYPYYYLADLASSEDDEFGPYLVPFNTHDFLFTFASNRTGNMDLYASHFDQNTFGGGSMVDPTPFRLSCINSSQYDAYATFVADASEIFFCSSRDGNLDIYSHKIEHGDNLLIWAKEDTVYQVENRTELNSPAEDACPYINGILMVFTSKRAGGYGGYDLYYSQLAEDGWSDPVNFGPEINTEYDEFRPAVFYAHKFDNDLMIFSSNRPGGVGGFDLYYVGIPKLMTQ